ncbi:hypothetical protein Btru_072308, partial [Bulinus truncatus]
MADHLMDMKTNSQLKDIGVHGANKKTDRLSNRPPLPTNTALFSRSKSDLISYEDLLVTEYMKEIKCQNKRVLPPKTQAPISPYLQKVSNSSYNGRSKYRPRSAVACMCQTDCKHENNSSMALWDTQGRNMASTSGHCHQHWERNSRDLSFNSAVCCCPPEAKPKIDAKFIADSSLWDPATPRSPMCSRPVSAPVKRLRPASGSSRKLRPSSAQRLLNRNQNIVLKACAYINGSRERFVHLAAPNMEILLQMATEKLGLPFAARKVFLENGREIYTVQDFFESQAEEIFVSMGEPFKNPDVNAKKNMVIKNNLVWTLNGINLAEKVKYKRKRTKMTKRMQELSKNQKVRVMIFVNGNSMEPNEAVADVDNFTDFLNVCTGKLNLPRPAKVAYDWNGKQITELSEILDESILPETKTPIRGPLWISTGERFSPTGTRGFFLNAQYKLLEKIKAAKYMKKQIDLALDNNKKEVTDPNILAMSSEDLYEAIGKVEDDIEKLKESLSAIKDKIEALESEAAKEEMEGLNYRLTHIKPLAVDDRLVGTKGIKLKVFENGKADGEFMFCFNLREAMKGTDKNHALLRLLDELSSSKFSAGVNRNLNAVATKLFDKDGREITDVTSLQPEQSVWFSFGEPFICPSTYALHVFLDKATKVVTSEGATKIVREAVTGGEEELVKDASKWEAYTQFPDNYEIKEQYDQSKIEYLLENSELDANCHYLLLKEKNDKALYAEISISEKAILKNQIFIYNAAGYLCCKVMPQICLAVSNEKSQIQLFNSDISVDGFAVCMQKKMPGNPCQIWCCLPDGTLTCQAFPGLLLTYTGHRRWDPSSDESASQPDNNVKKVSLIVTEPLAKKQRGLQRFAFKQERFDNLGQWKFTETTNPDWHKLAYSWPVKSNGELNKNYDWPMESYIIPNAPPIHKKSKKSGLSGVTPARLRVLKNGDRNIESAICVVGPNITNMVKDNTKKEPPHKQKKAIKDQYQYLEYSTNADIDLHCLDLSIFQMEFQMFLSQCTSLLNLPFAARRLFDREGKELFSIQNLTRDSLVFVSCGESWSDPKLTKHEQRRRFLLSQLSSDVVKIHQFCSMRTPENFVLDIDGPLAPGTGLVVNQKWTPDPKDGNTTVRQSSDFDLDNQNDEAVEKDDDDQDPRELTYHEISHMKSDEYVSNLRWPWEKLVNVSNSMDTEDPEINKYSDRDLYMKFRPQLTSRLSREAFQKFTFEDGYIAVLANRTFVLSLSKTEGRSTNVVLAKRQPDDINQRWIIKANGEIISRAHQNLILTVSLPPTSSEEQTDMSFCGSPITVQLRSDNKYGRAHQKWKYDPESGHILAFDSDVLDKEITAANRSDVCTYAVIPEVDIDQPGFLAEFKYQGNECSRQIKVCVSCARSMRGQFKVQRLPPGTVFHCAMGDAKKLKIQQYGSFKQLNNKADLSTHEAEVTLMRWQKTLESLKQQTSVKTIEKEINAFKTVKLLKVLAYKNGEGRLRKGEMIRGSSIEGILSQCMHRLGLNSAARRMYLEDGTMALDIDDLIRYAEENYKTEMVSLILARKSESSTQE